MPYLEKIKEIKESRNLTNTEIASLSNIPLATVTRILNGSTPNPTFETIASIATAIGASLDELVGLKDPDEQPLNSRVETAIASYAELLAEKDARLREKDEYISHLRAEKTKEQKEKGKLLTFTIGFVAIVIFVLLFDMMNGHFGYFRY